MTETGLLTRLTVTGLVAITVLAGVAASTASAGQSPRIDGLVWVDGNADGVRQDTEKRQADATLDLISLDPDRPVRSTRTGGDGRYAFTGLEPGSYEIRNSTGLAATKPGVGDESRDSDFDWFTGRSQVFECDATACSSRHGGGDHVADLGGNAQRMDIAAAVEPRDITVRPNSTYRTEIVISNPGNTPKRTEAVRFAFPEGFTVRAATGRGWDCSPEGGVIDGCYTEAANLPAQSLPPIAVEIEVGTGAVAGDADVTVYGFSRSESDPANNTAVQRIRLG